MAMARLFSRSRPMSAPRTLMPPCSTLNCSTSASSESETMYLIKKQKRMASHYGYSWSFDQKVWNMRRKESETRAKREGSPFTLLEDHISTNNSCYNSESKKLEEQLRSYKDINSFTEINSIIRDERLKKFRSTMTEDEIRNSVMRHLYVLTLQEVIPTEKLYMEDLINEDLRFRVEYRWRYRDFHSLYIIHSKRFGMLPERRLRRGVELHMSRIPHEYSSFRYPEVFKKKLMTKLESDYKILTSKIHDLPTISEEMMATEIKSFVDHVPDANLTAEDPGKYCPLNLCWLGRPNFH